MPPATPHRDADAPLAPLTADDVRHQTDEGSWSRGRAYFRQGRVHDTVLRGDTLEARCDGSDPQPYRVRATLARAGATGAIAAASENPVDVSCTCPRGGFCKHIVAVLLAWIDRPTVFAERASVEDQLASRSPEELIALVARMVRKHPDLEILLELPLPEVAASRPGSPNVVSVDERAIRRQVRSALAELREGGHADSWHSSWGGGWRPPDELPSLVELGRTCAGAGRWADAVVVFSATVEEIIEEAEDWMFSYDESGEFSDVVIACDTGLATCLDAQPGLDPAERLSGQDRERAFTAIFNLWRFDVFDMGGIDLGGEGIDGLIRNVTAEERSTVLEWLRAEASQASATPSNAGFSDWRRDAITGLMAELLDAGGAGDEEILTLYRDAGLWHQVAARQLGMGRVDDAVATAQRNLRTAPALTSFASALIAHDAALASRAIALVDDLAWEVEGQNAGHDAALESWLIDRFSQHDRPREALKLAERRFRRKPSLPAYQAVERAAALPGQDEDAWDALRPSLHEHLRQRQEWPVLMEASLHDGDVAAALAAYDTIARQRTTQRPGTWAPMPWGYGDQELRLARAAEADFPDRAVDIYRNQAERAIEGRQRASYRIAARHLVRARETLERHGRDGDWTALIADIRERNKTLRALREELDNAGL